MAPFRPATSAPASHDSAREATQGARRRSWEGVSVAIAVVGLRVALVFNTVGVWRQVEQDQLAVEQARQTRVFTQLGLLTQLGLTVTASERAAASANEHRCDGGTLTNTLDPEDKAALWEALSNYEYLAWLFNHKHLTLSSARRFWAPYMLDAYNLGTTFVYYKHVQDEFPELTRFRRTTPHGLQPTCPKR
jgi:hypothetical protein